MQWFNTATMTNLYLDVQGVLKKHWYGSLEARLFRWTESSRIQVTDEAGPSLLNQTQNHEGNHL